MQNFSEYLDLNPSLINQCFNTVTREGQDQIFFDDVIQIIGYLEEAKFKNDDDTLPTDELKLSPLEMKLLLDNFLELSTAPDQLAFTSKLNDVMLMFVVEFESRNGRGSAPDIFCSGQQNLLFPQLKCNTKNFKSVLSKKLKEKASAEVWALDNVKSVVIFEKDRESEGSTAEKRGRSFSKNSNLIIQKGSLFINNHILF